MGIGHFDDGYRCEKTKPSNRICVFYLKRLSFYFLRGLIATTSFGAGRQLRDKYTPVKSPAANFSMH